MYTKKDDRLRGLLIPVLVIGIPVGLLALMLELGVNPNVTGLTLVAILVGLVAWRIRVARHPEGWPLPKKVFHALRALGFRGAKNQGGQGDDVFSTDDGFSVTYTENSAVDANMNEKTRELSLMYRRRDRSWLRNEDAFHLVIERSDTDGDALVIAGTASSFRYRGATSAEKKLAVWIGAALGPEMLSLPLTRIDASKKPGNNDPRLSLDLTIPEGTFVEISQVISRAKDLFWKLMGAIEAERTDNWLK